MGLKEVNGLKGARKERKKKTMGSIWCGKVRIGRDRPKIMKAKKEKG